jgi:hypothetical protein
MIKINYYNQSNDWNDRLNDAVLNDLIKNGTIDTETGEEHKVTQEEIDYIFNDKIK